MASLSKKHVAYLSASLFLYILFVGLYTGWSNWSAEKRIYDDIDLHLLIAAGAVRYILPDDFHDRALDKDSISLEEELKIREALAKYTRENNFAYIHTLVEKDGRFYMAATTVTEANARERESWYYYPYDYLPEEFIAAYHQQATAYATYSDQWGTFRSVALPQQSPGGRMYLVCADYDVANVRELVYKQTITAALTALAFLLLVLPFILVYRSIHMSYRRRLLNEILERRETESQLRQIQDQLEERVDRRTSQLQAANEDLRKEIEERRRTSEDLAKAHDILNQSPVVGFLLENRAGWPVDYVTENAEAVLGYSDKAFTSGKVDYLSIIVPEDRERVIRETTDSCLMSGNSYSHEPYRIVTKRGEERWVADSKTCVIDDNGRVTHYQAIIADVTDRKRLQEWVEQTRRIEGLGRVAGGVAHDFNNILMGIVGNTELALAKMPTDSEFRYYLEQISELCQRAADLVKQMLDFSGKTRPLEDNINVSDLIKDFSGLLKSSISKKAVLTEDLTDPLPPIKGNPGQLRDMIINLVTNASEALDNDEGEIRIATGVTYADDAFFRETYFYAEQQEGDYVYLEISDTGRGMTDDVLSKIFDPFFSTKFIGRGLGLASVEGIARSHQGAIKVESVPDKGSKFSVFFPAFRPSSLDVKSKEGDAVPWKDPGQIMILVADDEEQVRNMLAEMLESLGYQVIPAIDGSDALNLFKQHANDIDLVILDRTMPQMSGEEAFGEITRIKKDIPVIFSSGYSESDLPADVAGRKNVAFLQKPFRLGILHATIQAFFPNRQTESK